MSDLILRADAMAYPLSWKHYDKENGSREFICGVESYREYIENLPSAEAEPSLKAIKRQIDEHWYLGAPSAEAVQVVRCKDCINYEKNSLGLMGCRITQYVADDDDFCSWGERKGGDDE